EHRSGNTCSYRTDLLLNTTCARNTRPDLQEHPDVDRSEFHSTAQQSPIQWAALLDNCRSGVRTQCCFLHPRTTPDQRRATAPCGRCSNLRFDLSSGRNGSTCLDPLSLSTRTVYVCQDDL